MKEGQYQTNKNHENELYYKKQKYCDISEIMTK